MESTKRFKQSLIKKKPKITKEVVKNKNVFIYTNDNKVSKKEKEKVITVIKKKKCDCGCENIKQMKKKY